MARNARQRGEGIGELGGLGQVLGHHAAAGLDARALARKHWHVVYRERSCLTPPVSKHVAPQTYLCQHVALQTYRCQHVASDIYLYQDTYDVV